MINRIVCFFLGHYTGTSHTVFEKEAPINIVNGFGGFRTSDGRKYCLRCDKLMPKGFSRIIER